MLKCLEFQRDHKATTCRTWDQSILLKPKDSGVEQGSQSLGGLPLAGRTEAQGAKLGGGREVGEKNLVDSAHTQKYKLNTGTGSTSGKLLTAPEVRLTKYSETTVITVLAPSLEKTA